MVAQDRLADARAHSVRGAEVRQPHQETVKKAFSQSQDMLLGPTLLKHILRLVQQHIYISVPSYEITAQHKVYGQAVLRSELGGVVGLAV